MTWPVLTGAAVGALAVLWGAFTLGKHVGVRAATMYLRVHPRGGLVLAQLARARGKRGRRV